MTSQAAKMEGCQEAIDYHFNNPDLLWEALQAAGSPVYVIGNRVLVDGNKRLAVLGDVVLKLVLVRDWYNGIESRGRMSQVVDFIGSNAHLNAVGCEMHLGEFINKNNSQRGFVSPNTMAATVEAILGAVFLDSGLDHVALVMREIGLMT